MKRINELFLKKLIFLLICVSLSVNFTGSAMASSLSTQVQSAGVSVNDGAVNYNVDQQQSAKLTEDGEITQAQTGCEKIFVNPNSGVEIITVRASSVQSVDIYSTDESSKKNSIISPKSNLVETINTDSSGEIELSQYQKESGGDSYQEQSAFLKIIATPNDKVHAIAHLKAK